MTRNREGKQGHSDIYHEFLELQRGLMVSISNAFHLIYHERAPRIRTF